METMGAHFSAIIESKENLPPGDRSYESARSGLYALLISTGALRIHVPNYICEAILDAAYAAGVNAIAYEINENFEFVGELELQPLDLVLLVDYFGLTEDAVYRQLERLPKTRVIVDCSQAYFQKPFDCLATIYSPRKFIPVADGGFVNTKLALECEASDENASLERYGYLLKRISTEPESSRDAYLRAEDSLKSIALKSMSLFSRSIAASADHAFITSRRSANFKLLSTLASINKLDFPIGNQTPLCYPLMVKNAAELRENLKGKRVFTPKYWPNLIPLSEFERLLVEDTVYLPVDHRYGDEHMLYMVDLIMSFYA